MNKLAKIIEGLSTHELELIHKDLKEGNIERLIAQRRTQLTRSQSSICPVCGQNNTKGARLILEFGPHDLRQKATFDAPDCLHYFVNNNIQRHAPQD